MTVICIRNLYTGVIVEVFGCSFIMEPLLGHWYEAGANEFMLADVISFPAALRKC